MILRDVEGHWVHSPDILQNRTALTKHEEFPGERK